MAVPQTEQIGVPRRLLRSRGPLSLSAWWSRLFSSPRKKSLGPGGRGLTKKKRLRASVPRKSQCAMHLRLSLSSVPLGLPLWASLSALFRFSNTPQSSPGSVLDRVPTPFDVVVTEREGTAKSDQFIHNDGLSLPPPGCLPDGYDARAPAFTGHDHLTLPPHGCGEPPPGTR